VTLFPQIPQEVLSARAVLHSVATPDGCSGYFILQQTEESLNILSMFQAKGLYQKAFAP